MVVAPKKADLKNPKADSQFEIGFVNEDGTVGLHPLDNHGKLLLLDADADGKRAATVVMTDQVTLQKEYKIVDSSSRLSVYDDLSFNAPSVGEDFWQAVATQALFVAGHQHRTCPADSIYIQKSPGTKIIAASVDKLPDEGFIFTPFPGVVKAVPKNQSQSAYACMMMTVATTTSQSFVFVVDKPDMGAKLALEFWRMRRHSDKDYCNMELSTVDVTMPIPSLGKGYKKSVVVTVPIAKPFKDIGKGDELVLFIPPKKKEEKKDDKYLPVVQEPVPKKAKTE